MDKNLFSTVLTYAAPSSNYRGESEENRTIIQKISRGGQEYAVISPESMRNALRESLAQKGLPMNRKRLHNEDQLAVEYQSYPNAEKYADDFLFGFMVADPPKEMTGPSKRDSVLRMNLAVALNQYRFDATFHQSPKNAGASPWKNADSSQLLHREVSYTAYQYPFALSFADCKKGPKEWTRALLEAIGELSEVAGNHARSLYQMAPRSLVARLTSRLAAGFDTYGFDEHGRFVELSRIGKEDLPGAEFYVAGEVVRAMAAEERHRLEAEGVKLMASPEAALRAIAGAALES